MADHYVCLTFDFDSVALWMALGQTSPTPLSRGEFGVVGAQRLLSIMAKHQINSTWFIPGVTIETYGDTCRDIHCAGHEIGHHGFHHVSPVKMTREEELLELRTGNDAIRSITGGYAKGYRSPAWDLSDNTIELLIDQGFDYDSSMMGHDHHPYYARQGDRVEQDRVVFGDPSTLVELPISWSLDDFPHFEYFRGGGLMNANQVLENWVADFEFMQQDTEWGVLTYTFHPFVIGRGHRVLMFEELIVALKDRGAKFLLQHQASELFRRLSTHHMKGINP